MGLDSAAIAIVELQLRFVALLAIWSIGDSITIYAIK